MCGIPQAICEYLGSRAEFPVRAAPHYDALGCCIPQNIFHDIGSNPLVPSSSDRLTSPRRTSVIGTSAAIGGTRLVLNLHYGSVRRPFEQCTGFRDAERLCFERLGLQWIRCQNVLPVFVVIEIESWSLYAGEGLSKMLSFKQLCHVATVNY